MLVEDENRMREFIKLFLLNENYEVIEAVNGEEALQVYNDSISLVLLDLMMPELSGYEVCKEIRKTSEVPIIILTAVDEDRAQLKCYEIGADDYLIKPFKGKILMAKIKRYLEKYSDNKDTYLFGKLMINTHSRQVFVGDKEAHLAPKEYDLLMYLILNKGIALSRDKIINEIWEFDFDGDNRVVDNHIKKLRKKLGDAGEFITTVVSIGYMFRKGDK